MPASFLKRIQDAFPDHTSRDHVCLPAGILCLGRSPCSTPKIREKSATSKPIPSCRKQSCMKFFYLISDYFNNTMDAFPLEHWNTGTKSSPAITWLCQKLSMLEKTLLRSSNQDNPQLTYHQRWIGEAVDS